MQNCTSMGFNNSLGLEFAPPVTEGGDWEFVLSGDAEGSCSISLPVADSDPTSGFECDGDAQYAVLSDDGTSVLSVVLFAAPESVTLEAMFDGGSVYSETLTPEYDVDEPNGGGCGERYAGVETLVVPSP